jgi:hypothetical protein
MRNGEVEIARAQMRQERRKRKWGRSVEGGDEVSGGLSLQKAPEAEPQLHEGVFEHWSKKQSPRTPQT